MTEISTLTIEASAVIRKGKKFISFEVTTLLADWQGAQSCAMKLCHGDDA